MSLPVVTPAAQATLPVLPATNEGTNNHSSVSSVTDSQETSKDSNELEKPGASIWSVFDDPVLAKHYAPPPEYEGYHRFDPTLVWTPEEEKKIIRKCDLRIAFFICVCFVALQLDRGNIVQALSDNFLKDLHLTTNDYNTGQTIFYVTFLFAELPSQLISKKLGVDRWVPAQMILWSIVAILQCKLTGRGSFFATRALLGMIEGGFIPDAILYLSYFYTGNELPIRLAYFWISLTSTTIIGSFLATGLLKLRGVHGWEGWRYLFLVEGLITLSIGIFAAFWFPPSPTETKGGIRGKGWFNEREETIIVTRVLKDDPSKSSMHNRQHIGFRQLLRSMGDYDHWPLYLIGLTAYIAPTTVTAYFTLTLRTLGFSTFKTNLLTIPSNVIFIMNNFILTYVSQKTKQRAYVGMWGTIWQLVLFIPVIVLPHAGVWIKFSLFTLLVGYPYAHPILVAWNSSISGSVATRSVSASLYNISVQLGNIIAANIYRTNDAPLYPHGNRILIAIVVVNLVLWIFAKVYYVLRNKQKAAIWNAMTTEEQDHYLSTTKDVGNRRLDFQFVH